jgi:hypothetical protein
MANPVVESAGYKNLSASGLVRTGAGQLLGIFVASSSSGTVKVWDNTSAATTVIVNTTSVSAGTFYPMPFAFNTGLFITIGGTADITVAFNPA